MRRYAMNTVIFLLVIANIFVGAMNYSVRRPKCISDDCRRARVTGTHYCKDHAYLSYEREVCLEVISKNSK